MLARESGGNGDDLKGLMGTAHKIKGSAASIGLNRIAKLAHLMEDLLEELLESGGSLSRRMTDVLLKCTDALQRHVTELKQGTARSDHFGQLARDLLAVRSGAGEKGRIPLAKRARGCPQRKAPNPVSHREGWRPDDLCRRSEVSARIPHCRDEGPSDL